MKQTKRIIHHAKARRYKKKVWKQKHIVGRKARYSRHGKYKLPESYKRQQFYLQNPNAAAQKFEEWKDYVEETKSLGAKPMSFRDIRRHNKDWADAILTHSVEVWGTNSPDQLLNRLLKSERGITKEEQKEMFEKQKEVIDATRKLGEQELIETQKEIWDKYEGIKEWLSKQAHSAKITAMGFAKRKITERIPEEKRADELQKIEKVTFDKLMQEQRNTLAKKLEEEITRLQPTLITETGRPKYGIRKDLLQTWIKNLREGTQLKQPPGIKFTRGLLKEAQSIRIKTALKQLQKSGASSKLLSEIQFGKGEPLGRTKEKKSKAEQVIRSLKEEFGY